MTRPLDKHIDSQELNALVPSNIGCTSQLDVEDIRVATLHVRLCPECAGKVSKYGQLIASSSQSSPTTLKGQGCPDIDDNDWFEVAAGLWPSLKASQLIGHSALCDHCGPRLRAAAFLYNDEPTEKEANLLAELKTPTRPKPLLLPSWFSPVHRWFSNGMAPAIVMVIILLAVIVFQGTARLPISGPEFAELAVHTHQQYEIGNLGLDVRTNSQQALNQWLQRMLSFDVALPVNSPTQGEVRPYQITGARLVQTAGKSSAFIAYQMDSGPVTLIVAPDTVAVASGGVEAKFKRLSFHYSTVEGYKVVTWTQRGRSYALVSDEGVRTQKSCMVCHSAMRDRDLTNVPTPLIESLVQ